MLGAQEILRTCCAPLAWEDTSPATDSASVADFTTISRFFLLGGGSTGQPPDVAFADKHQTSSPNSPVNQMRNNENSSKYPQLKTKLYCLAS